MTLKDLLKKKDKVKDEGTGEKPPPRSPDVPEFTFMRTTTTTQETFEPPSFPGDPPRQNAPFLSPEPRGIKGRFRRHSNASSTSVGGEQDKAKHEHRLFGRSRSSSSVNVPENLPDVGGDGVARNEEEEARWEKRATVLVTSSNVLKSGSATPNDGAGRRSRSPSVSNAPDDVCVYRPPAGAPLDLD